MGRWLMPSSFSYALLYCTYTTPSIIISSFEEQTFTGELKDYYEIIDGLQRLNAIVSFVNNDYGILVDGVEYFYDMQFIPTVLLKKLNGELKQREPVLDFKVCQDFADAEIPVILTSQKGNRDKKIECIFERINSSGRKLSAHDIRQASSLNEFPDLVRRVSMSIRGDFTYSDKINLCDMPKISLKNDGLDYGVDPKETFWRKHDIIPFKNFRQSKDEEVIASAMAITLLGENFRVNAESLNSLYRENSESSNRVTEIINEVSKDVIEHNAVDVFNQIDTIFDSVNSTFTSYLYDKKNTAAKDVSFITLFCTLYKLNRESYFIEDYSEIASLLKDHFDSTFGILANRSNHDNRVKVMNVLYNLLKSVMVKKGYRDRTEDEEKVRALLSLSSVESQLVEFKIGITYFETGKLNEDELQRIYQTLVAMANTASGNEEGYVIIGVANSSKSCSAWKSVYKTTPSTFGSHKVVGVTDEAVRCFGSEDGYVQRMRQLISNSLISEPLKSYVLQNYKLISFNDKALLLLPSKKQSTDSYYDGKFYVREGSSTIEKGIENNLKEMSGF